MHQRTAPAPGMPQSPARLFLTCPKRRVRLTVQRHDVGKATKGTKSHHCRRPPHGLTVDLVTIRVPQVRRDVGQIPQCAGDNGGFH